MSNMQKKLDVIKRLKKAKIDVSKLDKLTLKDIMNLDADAETLMIIKEISKADKEGRIFDYLTSDNDKA